MNKTIAYLRVSTDGQDLNNQKLELLDYVDRNNIKINEWLDVKVSSRKTTKERQIDLLLKILGSE